MSEPEQHEPGSFTFILTSTVDWNNLHFTVTCGSCGQICEGSTFPELEERWSLHHPGVDLKVADLFDFDALIGWEWRVGGE